MSPQFTLKTLLLLSSSCRWGKWDTDKLKHLVYDYRASKWWNSSSGWICLQGHFNLPSWTKCPILRELPGWKGSQTGEQRGKEKGNPRIQWEHKGRGKPLNHCGQEKHPSKGRLSFCLRRPGNEWDKRILATGTECPNVPKSEDTEQHNMCGELQMYWSQECEARSVGRWDGPGPEGAKGRN